MHRLVKMPKTEKTLMTVMAAGRLSVVLAGQFAGLDIEDPPHRREPCSWPWSEMIDKYSQAVVDHAGVPKGVAAMQSAMTVCIVLRGHAGHPQPLCGRRHARHDALAQWLPANGLPRGWPTRGFGPAVAPRPTRWPTRRGLHL